MENNTHNVDRNKNRNSPEIGKMLEINPIITKHNAVIENTLR